MFTISIKISDKNPHRGGFHININTEEHSDERKNGKQSHCVRYCMKAIYIEPNFLYSVKIVH